VTPTTAAREVEPLLAQGIRHGFVAETELAVDNRALVAALAQHCERLGVVGRHGSNRSTTHATRTPW
jgi:glycine oxidase